MADLDDFYGPNAGYVAELLDRLGSQPETVDPAIRRELTGAAPASIATLLTPAAGLPTVEVSAAASAAELAQAIRLFGHLAAQLDPLGSPPPGDPQLEPATFGLTEDDLRRLPSSVVTGPAAQSAAHAGEAIERLRRLYCHHTGYELAHIAAPAERAWLIERIESGRYLPPADPIDERALLDRLTELSAFERFLHRAYPGQTRFSIEGLGMLIPMLDELIDRAADAGTRTILLGMAHRGRLNVLAHVLGKPYRQILAEFEGRAASLQASPSEGADEGWTGDVKYHAGASRSVAVEDEQGTNTLAVIMAPNPSHLEYVNPVIEGMARAADEDRQHPGVPTQDEVASLAVLIHGDAAFPGQGIVAETFNLSRVPGYRTGGTIHIIANNQLGFTTTAEEGRSTLYASDLARGYEVPIIHVNADDPAACLGAIRLAAAYRAAFRKDVLIDLVGYRRWGHNEGDEPSFTQPALYAEVASHPTVREQFAADLVRRGVIQDGEPEALLRAGLDEFQRLREAVRAASSSSAQQPAPVPEPRTAPEPSEDHQLPDHPLPSPSLEALADMNRALLRFPDDFALNPKLDRALQRRRVAFDTPDATLDWGHAETLAFGWLLRQGTPVRLSGQDARRGTFSQRHLTFYDAHTGRAYTPLESLPGARASFEVLNSPLSESAVLGFEYGYSIQAPEALTLWEAQYGDFVNSAQVMVDEFVVSGEAKWGLQSGLVLLLPHAWEGQGPDHSSGRLERFLGLAAEDNVCIANCTTAAQYFKLLLRQAESLRDRPRPLIVMSPKSLLRHPLAASPAADLVNPAAFETVLDDPRVSDASAVRRLVLCCGKVWVDIDGNPGRADAEDVAVVRLEQLYPFPADDLQRVLGRYTAAEEVVWLQEEPANMGAWEFVRPRLRFLLDASGRQRELRYVGRPERASPAEGWSDVHAAEQRRIVQTVLEGALSHAI